MRSRWLPPIASAVIFLVGLWACLGPEHRLAWLFYDDAYYYLGVARHLADGEGSTFDGIHPTNGYHPLWCWALVPVVRWARDPGTALRAAAALWFLLASLVPLAAHWALRRRLGEPAAAVAAVIGSLPPWVGLALARPNGLETPLYALALLVTLGVADRVLGVGAPPRLARVAGVGLLAGTCLLARLDGGFLPPALALTVVAGGCARWGGRAALVCAATIGLAATAIAGPSLLWNAARFGSPIPVSGRVIALEAAQEREALGGALDPGYLMRRARYAVIDMPATVARRAVEGLPGVQGGAHLPVAIVLLAVAAMAAATLAGAWRRRVEGVVPGDPVATLACFCAAHYAAYAAWLWTPGEDVYRAYYFMPEVLLAAVLAAPLLVAAARRLPATPRARAIAAWAAVALLATHTAAACARQSRRIDPVPGPVAGQFIYGWIKRHLPADAILGARDAGKLGWFSGRTVVNLDGLVNDSILYEALRDGREGAYLCASPVEFVLIDRPWLGAMREELARTGRCALRDLGPATDDWAVLEVVRTDRTGG